MAVTARYRILAEFNLVFMIRTGSFEPGAMRCDITMIVEDPAFRQGMNFLIDATGVDYGEASYDKLSQYTENWEETNQRIEPCRMALLHGSSRNFGISRMTGTLFEGVAVQRRPFLDLKEALRWLELPEDFTPPNI